MSIVINEYDWAEKMISAHDLGSKPSETLSRISKYYYENKYSKKEIRSMLDAFILQCDPSASLVGWSDALDKISRGADKYKLVRLDFIPITDKELEYINVLKGNQLRRLAFTLLCVSKYWNTVSASNDNWVNTEDREIMKMANIKTTIKRQSMMFAELRNAGLIRFSKKIDNLNVQVLFISSGNTEIKVHDFRNLGYQYMKYCGGDYYECENCGITVPRKSNVERRPPKYCDECAVKVRTRQNIESAMRYRNMPKS